MQPYLRACDYVWLTAQADVDAALPCTEAISGVTLGSSVVPDPIDPITNVYNLRNLRNAWTLKVYNTALKDFRGLENARIVGAYKEVMIDISGNAHLERLTELNIDPNSFGFVFIRNNPELTTLEGLYGLQETQGLIIGNNDSLTTLEGIETLIDPGLYMIIEDNASLADITALQSIPPASTFAATIEDNPELDCTLTPLPSFLPLQSGDRSTGNLVNCPLTP
jgi:hypothetical protein